MRCSPAGVLRRYGHLYKGAGRQAAIALESQVSPDLKNPPYHPRTMNSDSGNSLENTKSPFCGDFSEADDGTRTHDLLHGKQTL